MWGQLSIKNTNTRSPERKHKPQFGDIWLDKACFSVAAHTVAFSPELTSPICGTRVHHRGTQRAIWGWLSGTLLEHQTKTSNRVKENTTRFFGPQCFCMEVASYLMWSVFPSCYFDSLLLITTLVLLLDTTLKSNNLRTCITFQTSDSKPSLSPTFSPL